MKFEYNGGTLIEKIRTKRLIELRLGVREASKKIGISSATLSRIENGKVPDVTTLASVCYWVSVPMESVFRLVKSKKKQP